MREIWLQSLYPVMLPAVPLLMWRSVWMIIAPLQSLMKDQVDNLAERGITDAVTINGLLDPISRSLAIQRVLDGEASLLYIAPESLRSKTIEKILLARHVVRFVIDEAHICIYRFANQSALFRYSCWHRRRKVCQVTFFNSWIVVSHHSLCVENEKDKTAGWEVIPWWI